MQRADALRFVLTPADLLNLNQHIDANTKQNQFGSKFSLNP